MHEQVSGLHQNIVGLKDCFFDARHLYFVFDGIFGGDLQEAIAERALFFYDDNAVRSVFAQIVDAVAFCHSQAIFHRDVKPSNILCSPDGQRIFLSGFGLATQKEVSDEFGVGTLKYMSPGLWFPLVIVQLTDSSPCRGDQCGRGLESLLHAIKRYMGFGGTTS